MRKPLLTIIAFVMCAGLALPARASERLNDKQVKAAVENLQRGFETWKDALEKRNLDDAVIRNASGTIEVKKFLKDFKEELDLLKDRVKPEYAANPEMTTVLRRASDVERRAQQPGQNPLPEWKTFSAQFAALAAAYGTTFPMPSADATAMRWADKEVAERLADIERQSKVVAKEADNAMKVSKAPAADRDKAKQALTALGASAKQTGEMLKKGTATVAQAEATLKAIKNAGDIVGGLAMAGPGKTAWDTIGKQATVVAKSFSIAS